MRVTTWMLGLTAAFDLTTAFLVVGLAGVALGLVLGLNAGKLDAATPTPASRGARGPPRGGARSRGRARR